MQVVAVALTRRPRYDYYTVLTPDLASFLRLMDSDTMEPDVLELFLDEMLIDLLYAEYEAKLNGNVDWQELENAVLFEIRGYFQGCLEFYVKQRLPPPTEPFRKRRGPALVDPGEPPYSDAWTMRSRL